ncbi:MAG: hypothetical protein IKC49_02145 [Clostridia bacterium]|nr:hypothetical protein [Clostridia bacterium]
MTKQGKLIQRILFVVLAISTAFICLSFGLRKDIHTYAVSTKTTIGDTEYSAKFGGDVIFTAERVGIVADSEEYKSDKPIDTNSETPAEDCERVYDHENKERYYIDIASGSKAKSVIDNGDVVMLYNESKIGDQYYNNKLTGYYNTEPVKVSEAILISFGQFVYQAENNSVTAPNATNVDQTAGITHPGKITIQHNGGTAEEIPLRQITQAGVSGTRYDFSYLITQTETSAGYYKIVMEGYSIGGQTYSAEFEFYLLFNSTYSANIEEGDHAYSAKPTISWYDTASSSVKANGAKEIENGYYRYYVGEDGVEGNNVYYPVLTYDYTKYSMNYDHTANHKKTNYKYEFDFAVADKVNDSDFSNSASMNLTITSGKDNDSTTLSYELNATYRKNNANNLVSIVLTEPGTYVFNYDYIYAGYVPTGREKPDMAQYIDIAYADDLAQNVSIHSFELEYSRYEYTEAELKHLKIANNTQKIACIVPDGVLEKDLNKYKDKALGFTYEFDSSADARVGTVIGSEQAMIKLEDEDREALLDAVSYNASVDANIDTILENIKDNYINTNQGSLWFKYNDSFVSSTDTGVGNLFSKYFYSPNAIDDYNDLFSEGESRAIEFTNATTFNKTGYYLAIIGVKTDTSNVFWQVYAFKYTTDTIDINVEAVLEYNTDDEPIRTAVVGAGKYTGKDVQISWTPKTRFERDIKAYYYTTTNTNLSIQQIMNGTRTDINNGAIVGAEIENAFLKYLVVLESVGGSKTYRMFTIDRQDISGIKAFAVKKNYAMDGYYYSVSLDDSNRQEEIVSGITDSMATLSWNNKASGATIKAEYTFTPFVKIEKTDDSVKEIQNGNDYWYTTNYVLGDTIGSFDYARAESMSNIKYSTSIIEDQGIYVFTLTDEAGNSCRYMLVIDSTEAYFKIGTDYLTNVSKIYSNSTKIFVSTHKAFKLEYKDITDPTNERKILQDLITKIDMENVSDTNYFTGNGTNFANLKNIFTRYTNDGEYYLTIKNKSLNIYDNQQQLRESKAISDLAKESNRYFYTMAKPNSGASVVNTFYLLGANNDYSGKTNEAKQSKSYIKVEINTDNSLGRVFSSDDVFDFENLSKSKINNISDNKRVDTYTTDSANWIENNDNFAKATSANYVMFSWIVGTGIFEVSEVKYQYYQLDTTATYNSNTRYYNKSGDVIVAYNNTAIESAGCTVTADGCGVLKLYQRSATNDGLYVITRTYKDSGDVDYGDDKKILNYYFIVDKNGVYEVIDDARNNIYLNVLGNESKTNEFTGGYDPSQIVDEYGNSYDYKLYYDTNKVPATLSIPMGKYTGKDNKNTTSYYAGRLSYRLYFIDEYKQLINEQKQYIVANGMVNTETNGYFSIDLQEDNEMKSSKSDIISRFLVKDNDNNSTDWLALPGRYVLILQDNVKNPNGNSHYFAMGFRIVKPNQELAPNVEIRTEFASDETTAVSVGSGTDYTLYTSDEYVKIVLPKYIANKLKNPQVDQEYFDIYKDGQPYLYYRYDLDHSGYASSGKLSAGALNEYVNGHTIIKTVDGKRYLYLKTDMYNADGSLNLDSTTYTIKVRYKLTDDETVNADNGDKYKNAYYYYDKFDSDDKKTYYETTYTIIIDRVAPTKNVNNLIANDGIIEYYDETLEDFFTTHVYGGNGAIARYTYQYKDYYESVANSKTDKSKIFGFRIDNDTNLNFEDIYEIRFRPFVADTDTLSLPIATSAGFTTKTPDDYLEQSITYAEMLEYRGYYEILELDHAGNMTQYIVYLDNDTNVDNDSITIQLKADMPPDKLGQSFVLDNTTKSIYSLAPDTANIEGNEFYVISISKDSTTNIITDFTTKVDELDDRIAAEIKPFGNYTITISDASGLKITSVLNYYDRTSSTKINPKDIFVSVSGVYHIDLTKAVAKDENTGATYYAKKIVIYEDGNEPITYYSNDGEHFYLDEACTDSVSNTLILCRGNTYKVFMTDSVDDPYYTLFNIDGSSEYTGVDKENSKHYYQAENNTYYTFGDFYIWYSTSIYSVSDVSADGRVDCVDLSIPGIVKISNNGKSMSERFTITFSNVIEGQTYSSESYSVYLDTNVGNVSLKDNSSGAVKTMLEAYNAEPIGELETITGIMSLTWTRLENTHFTYKYTLKERVSSEITETTVFENGEISQTINTRTGSDGIYFFDIEVYAQDESNTYLGYKQFIFKVKGIGNKIYDVMDGYNVVKSNGTFVFSDLTSYSSYSAKLVDCPLDSKVPYPMYISTNSLSAEPINQGGMTVTEETIVLEEGVLTLHKFTLGDYSQYVLILKVKDLMGAVVNDLSVRTTENGDTLINEYNYMGLDIVGAVNDTISLVGTAQVAFDTSLLPEIIKRKNSLVIDIFYRLDNTNYIKVDSREIAVDGQNRFSLPIMGNGAYSFTIRDKAGNIHLIAEKSTFKINVLRQVAVAVNGMTPVNNAYYNDDVELIIPSSSIYKTITVTATKDGVPYEIEYRNPYIFSGYGYFVLHIEAVYHDHITNEDITLYNTIKFSIINQKEARTSIDLTNLSAFHITKVLDNRGMLCTDLFVTKIVNPNIDSGMILSYDRLTEHFSEDLNISSGMYTFTITYQVIDQYNMYPTSEITFSFALNNDMPTIDCSLKPGESTKKGFDITFRGRSIYEQIGESYIYINDQIVATIDENSGTGETKVSRTFKADGVGDYYIKLVTSSGTVLSSYKVTIKEPLNTWAIILIVVVAAVVITVVVVIIVLRHKMKIR